MVDACNRNRRLIMDRNCKRRKLVLNAEEFLSESLVDPVNELAELFGFAFSQIKLNHDFLSVLSVWSHERNRKLEIGWRKETFEIAKCSRGEVTMGVVHEIVNFECVQNLFHCFPAFGLKPACD